MESTRSSASREDSDRDAFADWIRPHFPVMRRVAERLAGPHDRDDVLQDALGSAWRYRARFDPNRGEAEAWLVTITVNAARKHLRRRRDLPVYESTPSPAPPDPDLHAAVRSLPRRQRLAIELFYFVGLPVTEVAAAMNCAEGTVKSTLSAARRALHDQLREDTP